MERYIIFIPADGPCRLVPCDDGDTCKLNTLRVLVDGPIEVTPSCLGASWAREPVDSIKLIVNEDGLVQEPTARPAVQWPGIRSVGGRRYLPP